MKNALNVLAILIIFNFLASCTALELNDDQTNPTEDVHATGDNSSGEIDNDREDG
ncbi:hypothetical protein [Subsaximicrobium wynnwilliamsii]|uniref:hypothetical protein n=1 Tax=Subsaximicrobium wynnwilliamsii TaxID=291179 RepID=UPI001672F9B7|nr:hypothetical protein [Subsaximicrobium wynnwilliamsii]